MKNYDPSLQRVRFYFIIIRELYFTISYSEIISKNVILSLTDEKKKSLKH